jgi:hypothetical protein
LYRTIRARANGLAKNRVVLRRLKNCSMLCAMEKHIFDTMQTKLRRIEEDHAAKILYPVESNSRTWDFASADSDYDMRFVYARPQNDGN